MPCTTIRNYSSLVRFRVLLHHKVGGEVADVDTIGSGDNRLVLTASGFGAVFLQCTLRSAAADLRSSVVWGMATRRRRA